MKKYWHLLSPIQLQEKFYIPQVIATNQVNLFYTDCTGSDNQGIGLYDETCKLIGLVPNESNTGLITCYIGNFSLEDIFDLYEFEDLESGTFNFLEVIDGHLSLNKELSLSLITLLEDYALKMPETDVLDSYTFIALNSTEIEYYRIKTYPNHIKNVYKLTSNHDTNQDVTKLISFNRAIEHPTLYGVGLTQFVERTFQNNPKFNVFINGSGGITLNKRILLNLISILKEWTKHLVI